MQNQNTFEVPFLLMQDWAIYGNVVSELGIPFAGEWLLVGRKVGSNRVAVFNTADDEQRITGMLVGNLYAEWACGMLGGYEYEIWHVVDGRADWYIDTPSFDEVTDEARNMWEGEGWYRIRWTDGGMDWTSNGALWLYSFMELADELRCAYEESTETHRQAP